MDGFQILLADSKELVETELIDLQLTDIKQSKKKIRATTLTQRYFLLA
jgi:hypothetical protein